MMYKDSRKSFITRVQILFTLLVEPAHSRVGYSSDTPNKATEETCESDDGSTYVCSAGHCCAGGGCCTYYYELWWFWLIWGVIILVSCCCAYHHRQKRRERHAQGSNSTAAGTRLPYAGVCNYPGPPLDNQVLGYCKLPVYDEIIRIPPTASPPPPYSSRRRSINTVACLLPNDSGEMQMTIVPCHVTASMLSLASLSYYIPSIISQNSNIQTYVNPSTTPNGQTTDSNNNNTIVRESCSGGEQSTPTLSFKKDSNASTTGIADVGSLPTPKSFHSFQEGCSYESNDLPLACSNFPPMIESETDNESDSYSDEGDYLLSGVDPNNNNQDAMAVHPKEFLVGRQSPDVGAGQADTLQRYDDIIGARETTPLSNNGDIVLHLTP